MIHLPVWYLDQNGIKITKTISLLPPTEEDHDNYEYILNIYGEVAKAFSIPERSIERLIVQSPGKSLYQLEIYTAKIVTHPETSLQVILISR